MKHAIFDSFFDVVGDTVTCKIDNREISLGKGITRPLLHACTFYAPEVKAMMKKVCSVDSLICCCCDEQHHKKMAIDHLKHSLHTFFLHEHFGKETVEKF